MKPADFSGWRFTDHVCRSCLGRVSERDGLFMCGQCEVTGRESRAICGCGLSFGKGRAAVTGFRCAPNPNPTPDAPQRFVILFGDAPAPVEPVQTEP